MPLMRRNTKFNFSNSTILTVVVTLFVISVFLYFLLSWNKCTESFAASSKKSSAKPAPAPAPAPVFRRSPAPAPVFRRSPASAPPATVSVLKRSTATAPATAPVTASVGRRSSAPSVAYGGSSNIAPPAPAPAGPSILFVNNSGLDVYAGSLDKYGDWNVSANRKVAINASVSLPVCNTEKCELRVYEYATYNNFNKNGNLYGRNSAGNRYKKQARRFLAEISSKNIKPGMTVTFNSDYSFTIA